MKLTVTFRHIDSTEAIKAHVEDKLAKLNKYLIRPIEVHVILSVEKFRQSCEMTVTAPNFHGTAIETSENLYASIDVAIHKLERQIKKYKEKKRDHKNQRSIKSVDLEDKAAVA